MNILRRCLSRILFASAFAWLSLDPAAAQERSEKIHLTPHFKDGVVLVRVPDASVPYLVAFQRTDSTGFGSRIYVLDVRPGQGQTYIARTLKPGRYRFTSLVQQKRWALGFGTNTSEFDVRAGRVSYLGELNADELLQSLQDKVTQAGKTTLVGLAAGFAAQDESTVQFGGRDSTTVAEARSFSMRVMRADKQAVELTPLLPLTIPTPK